MKQFGPLTLSIMPFLLVLFFPFISIAQVTSDFETADSLEGWRAVGDGTFYYEEGTGNPGNCMRVDDDATGNLLISVAPAKFLGDWSSAAKSDSITADIFLHRIGGSAFNPDWIYRISGPGGQAIALRGSDYSPPSDEWTHFAAPLDSTQWMIEEGSWKSLMQHVTMVEILTEFITGDEYVRLDNPSLTFTPEITDVTPPVYSEFDDGGWDGWSFVNTGGVSIKNSDGNPEGYIRISDKSNTISKAIASSAYLGNWQDLTNAAAIQLDLKIFSNSGDFLPNHELIRLSGPGGRATVPLDSSVLSAIDRWQSFSFMLNPTVWTVESGNWSELMSNVAEVSVYPEFFDGDEVIGLDNFRLSNDPPLVGFEAEPTFAFMGDSIQYFDRTKFVPESWAWSFGDGAMSNEQNPVHYYDNPGVYDVSLKASNSFGADTLVKEHFVEIASITDSILFFDDFENDAIHPAWSFRNGAWKESDGIMQQTSNYYSSGYINGAYAIVGSKLWSDYTITVDMHSTDNDKIGIVFRYQDDQNFYLFTWQKEGSRRYIKRFKDGQETDLAVDSVAYEQNTWYNVRLVTDGALFKCYVDSALVFEFSDSTFATGKAGLYCHGNDESYWDNFSATQTNYTPTDIDQQNTKTVVQSMKLFQNYPNPFNPSTKIRFNLQKTDEAVLNIYNVRGQRIKSFQPGVLPKGQHVITWRGIDQNGNAVASGLYFYELRSADRREVKKMFLLR